MAAKVKKDQWLGHAAWKTTQGSASCTGIPRSDLPKVRIYSYHICIGNDGDDSGS